MIRRLLIVITAVAALVGLTQVDDPHGVPQPAPSDIVGPSFDEGVGSTWFCPLGTAAAGEAAAPENHLLITTFDDPAAVRVTMLRTAPDPNGATTVEETLALPANAVTRFRIDDRVDGGASVEVTSGTATVAQELIAPNRSDHVDCLTEAGQRAYFASASTDAGATAQLWLTNPFSTDASVDIRVTVDSSVRVPAPFDGIIIPAGSTRMIDLATPGGAELREQFAFAVEVRGGRIVAGLTQTRANVGLRVNTGVQRPATNWAVPYSFTGAEMSERIWVYNPSETATEALVSVLPNGVASEMLPEPFVIDLPARRYGMVDLPLEGRLPTGELRWIQVEAFSEEGVVVSQVVSLNAASGDGGANTRPAIAGGLAGQSGVTVQATSWVVSSLDPQATGQSIVSVANPSVDTIAVVTLTRMTQGAEGPTEVIIADAEVAPLGTFGLDLADFADADISVRVDSTSPVVVGARTTNTNAADFAMWSAIPIRSTASPLPPTGG